MSQYIKIISDLSFCTGLIGYPEYLERLEVAKWLEDSTNKIVDPRLSQDERDDQPHEDECQEEDHTDEGGISSSGSGAKEDEPPWLELLMMNQWMFTIGDADCYPSVPHGHFQKKTREWPKLNPYTGRVFTNVHKEDTSKRLNKKDMKKIWNDSRFIEHCREQVLWYSDFAPRYGFPSARRGKLNFPRWR